MRVRVIVGQLALMHVPVTVLGPVVSMSVLVLDMFVLVLDVCVNVTDRAVAVFMGVHVSVVMGHVISPR